MKGWRGLWESTELDIGCDIEGEAREIGVFSMSDAEEELKRGGAGFGVDEVDERLRTGRSETGELVQWVGYWLAKSASASMNKGVSWNVR